MRMLARLLDFLFPRARTAELVSAATLEEFGRLVCPTITNAGSIFLLPYRHPLVRAVIIEAKFHRNPKAFMLLARVLTDYLDSGAEEREVFTVGRIVLVPIPLSRTRYQARGYNQVEEIARRTTYPVVRLLRRTRDTPPQTTLARRARLNNMEGAFAVSGTSETGCTYIVLDDVMTTGATLQAVADTLQHAGSINFQMVALAH